MQLVRPRSVRKPINDQQYMTMMMYEAQGCPCVIVAVDNYGNPVVELKDWGGHDRGVRLRRFTLVHDGTLIAPLLPTTDLLPGELWSDPRGVMN